MSKLNLVGLTQFEQINEKEVLTLFGQGGTVANLPSTHDDDSNHSDTSDYDDTSTHSDNSQRDDSSEFSDG